MSSSDFFGWKNADDGPEGKEIRSLNSNHRRDDWAVDEVEEKEEEEEEEVPLEIEDFGCETSFEVTCMAIEEFLRDEVTKLTRDGSNRDQPHILRKASTTDACLSFSSKMPFAVKEFSTERGDALEISIFHNAHAHPISKWTGLSTFAIVKGRINTNPTRSDSCLYLSYLTCACDALGLPMACFTPTGDAHRETFVGYGRNPPTVSRFSLEVFPQGPPLQCRSLSGLVDLLLLNIGLQSRVCEDRNGSSVLLDHERVYRLPIATTPLGTAAGVLYASPPSTSSPRSVASTQFLDERHVWVDALRAMNEACLERCGTATVPFGPTTCPIVEVLAVCRWLDLDERGVVDTESRSDFDVTVVNASLSVVSTQQSKGAEDARRVNLRGTVHSRPRVGGAESRNAVELVLKTADGANGSPHAISILRACTPYLKCRLDNLYGLTFHAADTFDGVAFLLLTHLRALAVSNGANYNNGNVNNSEDQSSVKRGHKGHSNTTQEEGGEDEDQEAAARRDELHLRNWRAVEEEPRATQEAFRSLVFDVLNTDPIPPLPVTSRCVTSLWENETLEIGNNKSTHLRSLSSSPWLLSTTAGGDIRTTYIPNSFLNRCAHYAGKVLTHPDDVFILWLEAVEGLRKLVWEYLDHPRPNFESAMRSIIGVGLSGDAETVPDLDAPLIVQKMQMLHYCLFQHERGVVAKVYNNNNNKSSGRAWQDESTTSASPANAMMENADGWDADGIDFESCTENSSESSTSPLQEKDAHQSTRNANKGRAEGGKRGGGWDEDDDLSFGSEEEEGSEDSDGPGGDLGAASRTKATNANSKHHNNDNSDSGDEESFEPLSEAEETVSGSAALERKMRKTKGSKGVGGGIRGEDQYSYFSSRQRTEQFRDSDAMKSPDGENSPNNDDIDDQDDGPRSPDSRHHHRLLLRHGEEMVVPPPRRVTPKTRDIIEAEQAELYKLGTAAAGASARMWLQSRVLKDDMVYFRACQPQGATVDFVDFVRWHSPKDYLGPPFDSPDLSVAESDEMRREAALQPTTRLISIRMGGQRGNGEGVDREKSKDKPAELYGEEGVAATYNTWLSLWEEACSVTDPSYLEDAFHPELEARRILSWLADCVTTEDVLVHFTIATAANALHRMACHPMVILRNRGGEETSLENAGDDSDHKDPTTVSENNNNNSACPLKSYLRYVAAEMACVGKGMADQMAHCTFEVHSEVEAIKGGTTALASLIRETELAVSAALSLRLFLVEGRRCMNTGGEDNGKGKNGGRKSVPAWATQRLFDELAQCAGAIAMTGLDDLRSKAHTTTTSGDILSSRRADRSSKCIQPPAIDIVAISPNTFWCVVAPLLSSSSSSSSSSKSSSFPSETKYALRCEAERPMHSESTLQRLLVTTDRHGTCRIAMALTEEVY